VRITPDGVIQQCPLLQLENPIRQGRIIAFCVSRPCKPEHCWITPDGVIQQCPLLQLENPIRQGRIKVFHFLQIPERARYLLK